MDANARLIDAAPRTVFEVSSLRALDLLDAQVAFLGVPYDGGTPSRASPPASEPGPRRPARRAATWIVTHFLSEIFDQPR